MIVTILDRHVAGGITASGLPCGLAPRLCEEN